MTISKKNQASQAGKRPNEHPPVGASLPKRSSAFAHNKYVFFLLYIHSYVLTHSYDLSCYHSFMRLQSISEHAAAAAATASAQSDAYVPTASAATDLSS